MYQIPHGEVHILHIYICVHTPHVRDTGRSPHGAGPGATDESTNLVPQIPANIYGGNRPSKTSC
jgi:hypothetical protein